MAFQRRDEIEARQGRDIAQMARRSGGSFLFAVMVVGAVLVGLVVSSKVSYQFDTSVQGTEQLSPQTREVLANLEYDVKLYALYRQDDAVAREDYWKTLKKYADASPKVDFEFYDPIAQPGIVRRLGLGSEEQGLRESGVTVAKSGDRSMVFRGQKEEAITNAILEVGRQSKRVVGILRGYGERSLEPGVGNGLSAAVIALQQEYYEVVQVSLADGIPREVSVLIVADPRLPVPEDELALLAEWLERGGRMLALLESDDRSGLNAVLDRWGLNNTGQQLVDPRNNVNRNQRFIKVDEYTNHEVVRGFGKNLPTAFPTAGVVTHFEVEGEIYHTDLAMSSSFSSAFSSDGTMTPGPLSVAVASWKQATLAGAEIETRILLVGDADFASATYLSAQANRNFLLNAMGWLTRQEELISIRRQPLEGQAFTIDQGERLPLRLAAFGAPILVAIVGFVVFMRRRGR